MSDRRAISFLFVSSLAIRLAWLLSYPRVIENEGAQYLRLAQNLFAHRGYMAMRGPVTMVSPLYSILIGIITFLIPSPELAGRLISLLAGAVLPLLILLIALKIHGRRPAFAAGVLAALHPLLIALSATVYSEGVYLALLMGALYATIATFEGRHRLAPVIAGICAGLAYLARPEGLLYAILFAFWIVAASWLMRFPTRQQLKRSVVLLTVSIVVALPFIVFLTQKTGRFYWEGKSSVNDNIVLRMKSGMNQLQANSGLGANGSEDGVGLEDDQFLYARTHPVPLAVKFHLIADGWGLRFLEVLRDLRSANYLGSPFVWLLAAVGLLGGKWKRLRLAHEGLLCAMTALLLLILGSMHFVWDRFLFPILPLLVLWAAHGAVVLYEWIEGILVRMRSEPKWYGRILALALPVSGILLLLVASARGVGDLGEIREARAVELETAGLWIASHGNVEKTVMTVGMVVPFYAGATARLLPYTDSVSALEYLHRHDPDFIVLRDAERDQRPYLPEWLQNGIPDACAHMVHRLGEPPEHEIVIYEWSCRQKPTIEK
jgi:4-amino-4-deoxy-L-arabinose transferase-like glycosyltransferase